MTVTLAPDVVAALVDKLDELDIPAKRMRGTDAADRLEAAADTVSDARRKAAHIRRMDKLRQRQRADEQYKVTLPIEALTDEQRHAAWRIVGPLWPTLERIVEVRRRTLSRLGTQVEDDVVSEVSDRLCVAVQTARPVNGEPFTVDDLAQAAHELADRDLPRSQRGARKWLLAMASTLANNALYDAVDMANQHPSVSWDEAMDSHAAVAALAGRDRFYDHFHADAGMSLLGSRYVQPGVDDGFTFLVQVTEAITERRLDFMAEVVLANLRADGTMSWRACARQVFQADPASPFADPWRAVCSATASSADPDGRRALAARQRARDLFEWLPAIFAAQHA